MTHNLGDDRYRQFTEAYDEGAGAYGGYGGDAPDDPQGGGLFGGELRQSTSTWGLASGARTSVSIMGKRGPAPQTLSLPANMISDQGSTMNSYNSLHRVPGGDTDSYAGGGGNRAADSAANGGAAYFENQSQ